MAKFSVEEYIKHLDSVIDKLNNELAITFETIWAKDMAARINRRVEVDRKTAIGGSFSAYTPKYLNWKRTKKGFVGTDKNFALTREMWKGFDVVNKKRKPGLIEVDLGGKTADSQIRINVNSEREKRSIIEASKQEEDAQNAFLQKWLNEFLRQNI